jgi:hypothetical protein
LGDVRNAHSGSPSLSSEVIGQIHVDSCYAHSIHTYLALAQTAE